MDVSIILWDVLDMVALHIPVMVRSGNDGELQLIYWSQFDSFVEAFMAAHPSLDRTFLLPLSSDVMMARAVPVGGQKEVQYQLIL